MRAATAIRGRHIITLLLLVSASLALASCVTLTPRHIADPGEFARNLFRIAEQGDAREWGTQLTEERRAMGEPYVLSHFQRWQATVLELKPAFGMPLEQVPFRLSESNGLEFQTDKTWHLLLRVKMEDGGLKINQD